MTDYNIKYPVLYSAALLPEKRIVPISASLTLSMKPLSTANLTVSRDEGVQIHDWIELFTPHGSAGIFRVSQIEDTFNENEVSLTLEHGLCVLRDAIADIAQTAKRYTAVDVRATTTVSYTGTKAQVTAACKAYQDSKPGYTPNWAITSEDNGTYFEGTPENVLQQILTYQTIKVNNVNLWQKGTVTPTASVKIEVNHDNCLDLLDSLMEELQGYMLTYDMSSIPWSVNIVAKPSTVSSEGRLSRNLTNAQISYDDSELVTRVYMDGLTNGYMDADTVGTYGIVGTYIKDGDTLSSARKQAICQRYLDKHKHPAVSINLDAVELRQLTGDDLDAVEIGRKYRVALPDYDTTLTEQVVTLNYPDVYGQPGVCRITLANDTQVLINQLSEMKRRIGGGGSRRREDAQEEDAEREKIRYDLQVSQTNKYFSILATEEEWFDAAQDYLLTHKTQFYQDARKFDLLATANEYAALESGGVTLVGQSNSRYTQTASQISTLVQKTGINSLGQSESLFSKISQSASQITSIVAKTGINNLGSNQTLFSRIDQNATEISSKVSNGSVISAINQTAETIKIQAGKINLVGYVTATELDAEKARFDNLVSGTTTALKLRASSIQTGSIAMNDQIFTPTTATLASVTSFTVLSPQSSINLNHAHYISSSVSSAGVVTITIGGAQTTSSSSRTTNFNIADTQYYQTGVSAAYNNGWKAASNAIVWASSTSVDKTSMAITYPNTSIGTSKMGYYLQVPTVWRNGQIVVTVRQQKSTGAIIMQKTVSLPTSGTWDVHTDIYQQIGVTVYANFTICGKKYSTSVVI